MKGGEQLRLSAVQETGNLSVLTEQIAKVNH
jgi:hypothetical protein